MKRSQTDPDPKHLPWAAMLDAIVESIEEFADLEPTKEQHFETKGSVPRRKIELSQPVENLWQARDELLRIRNCLSNLLRPYIAEQEAEDAIRIISLVWSIDNSDARLLRRMHLEGKEGWARLVEDGVFLGPEAGTEVAAIIRGGRKFRQGKPSSASEERERIWAVKRIATIMHLFALAKMKAVDFYCENNYPDDSEEKMNETVRSWVTRRQKSRQSGASITYKR